MGEPLFRCHRCRVELPEAVEALRSLRGCPACQAGVEVAVFPGWERKATVAPEAQMTVGAGEATCFFHASRRAVVPCDHCGRFLCALCDFPLDGRHWCPGCLEASARKNQVESLERSRVRWDLIVWYLLLFPILLFGWPAVVTAPAALVIALWKRRSAPSLVARSALRLNIGIAVAVLEILGVIYVFWRIFNS
mgnify:CR=1 FL=1